jgi:hypothetical protein
LPQIDPVSLIELEERVAVLVGGTGSNLYAAVDIPRLGKMSNRQIDDKRRSKQVAVSGDPAPRSYARENSVREATSVLNRNR